MLRFTVTFPWFGVSTVNSLLVYLSGFTFPIKFGSHNIAEKMLKEMKYTNKPSAAIFFFLSNPHTEEVWGEKVGKKNPIIIQNSRQSYHYV